jgi:hypothetical protein
MVFWDVTPCNLVDGYTPTNLHSVSAEKTVILSWHMLMQTSNTKVYPDIISDFRREICDQKERHKLPCVRSFYALCIRTAIGNVTITASATYSCLIKMFLCQISISEPGDISANLLGLGLPVR